MEVGHKEAEARSGAGEAPVVGQTRATRDLQAAFGEAPYPLTPPSKEAHPSAEEGWLSSLNEDDPAGGPTLRSTSRAILV